MRLMVLGGGFSQLRAIRRAKERGFEVMVADYDPDAPGHALADRVSFASTFNPNEVIADARRFRPDGIITLGTDQPVLTAALAADELGLPFPLDPETALVVTNKKAMKNRLSAAGLPVTDYRILTADFTDSDLTGLTFPAVTKPLDSQGQRGVFLVDAPAHVKPVVPEVLRWSRQDEFILESFYPSEEITVNGWVTGGRLHILTVVDRVTRMFPPNIGVCTAHRYPSRHLPHYGAGIIELSEAITEAAGITEGPVYYQMLIGNEGIRVNEIACRLGGAYEDRYMVFETGVDTVDLLIDSGLGRTPPAGTFSACAFPGHRFFVSVPLVFTGPGIVAENGSVADILEIPGVIGGGYLLQPGTHVGRIENSTRRAAWAVITGATRKDVNSALDAVFTRLNIRDIHGRNMVMDFREDARV